MTREQAFLAHLPLIQRVVDVVCARRGLRGADAEDFASIVKSRIIAHDYEILAKFQGRSSLRTYLTVVVNRLYVDDRIRRFGRWRPSAEARRLGPLAMHLERLLYRDGLTFAEACGVLLTGGAAAATREELYELSVRLPYRGPRGDRGEEVPVGDAGRAAPDAHRSERQALADEAFATIHRSLGRLSGRERVVLRLFFEEGLTVAQIARSLGLDQKALYRRKEEILRCLRRDLAAAGISRADVLKLLATLDWSAEWLVEDRRGTENDGSSLSQGMEGQK